MNTRAFRFIGKLVLILGMLAPGTAAIAQQAADTVDVRIWTETSSGISVIDVCYELVGYSNIGCDENGDGAVLFQDIPFGEYVVEPSYPYGASYAVEPFVIVVDGSNTDFFALAVGYSSPPQTPIEVTDIFLITRDPKTGGALTDVCYELVGYSNIGCDENNDGRVRFADIPYGQYVIRQTTTPAGYAPMDDYVVNIMGGPEGFNQPMSLLLAQSKSQAPEDRFNMSVVYWSPGTHEPIANADNCARLFYDERPVTNVGCDDDIVDGQIDFVNLEFDPNDAKFALQTNLACQYDQVSNPQILWIGQSSFLLFVEVEISAIGCE